MWIKTGIHHRDRYASTRKARVRVQPQPCRQNTECSFRIERPHLLYGLMKGRVSFGKQDLQEILLDASRATTLAGFPEGIPACFRVGLPIDLHATTRALRTVFQHTLQTRRKDTRVLRRQAGRSSCDSAAAIKFRLGNALRKKGGLTYSQRVTDPSEPSTTRLPRGVTAFGLFLLFGTAMALLAATTLLFSGTPLDRIWFLNPRAYRELAPFGKAAGVGFALLAATLSLAAVGWFRRRRWGWRLAVALIAVQVLGNLVNFFQGRVVEGAVGITIAGALLVYLLRRPIRILFPKTKNIRT